MDRASVVELQYISAIANLGSILERGILSHDAASSLEHVSLADKGVQGLRATKQVPRAKLLHHYANLYFNARNPMLFRLVCTIPVEQIAVVRIGPEALDVGGAVIADYNAAKSYAGFWPSPAGLARLKYLSIHAHFWVHPDPAVKDRKAAATQAELLVPNCVPRSLIVGIDVANADGQKRARKAQDRFDPRVNPTLFFEDRRRDDG